jgi:hypothetical protein
VVANYVDEHTIGANVRNVLRIGALAAALAPLDLFRRIASCGSGATALPATPTCDREAVIAWKLFHPLLPDINRRPRERRS